MMHEKPRLILVSHEGTAGPSPRGTRTRALVDGLEADWELELIAGRHRQAKATSSGEGSSEASGAAARKHLRAALRGLYGTILIDKYEPWSKARFAGWRPHADLALLIGYPFSPVVEAARRLARRGIPYIVDMGDPWILTGSESTTGNRPRALGLARSRFIERKLWASASGAIVTSERQADALRQCFPHQRIMVRPNGYTPIPAESPRIAAPARLRPAHGALRLAHFGSVYRPRVDVRPALERLATSGLWECMSFHQYGEIWDLRTPSAFLPDSVELHHREQRPWHEILEASTGFDLAVVIGNRSGVTLPSKVIQYLTLPIPRLALVNDAATDETAAYLRDKPSWLVVSIDDPDIAEKVAQHVDRRWEPGELDPPESESWPRVTQEISTFLEGFLRTP